MAKSQLIVQRDMVWIDVTFHRESREGIELYRDYLHWCLDNDIYGKGRDEGPLGFSGSFRPKDAEKLLAWLKERGVEANG